MKNNFLLLKSVKFDLLLDQGGVQTESRLQFTNGSYYDSKMDQLSKYLLPTNVPIELTICCIKKGDEFFIPEYSFVGNIHYNFERKIFITEPENLTIILNSDGKKNEVMLSFQVEPKYRIWEHKIWQQGNV